MECIDPHPGGAASLEALIAAVIDHVPGARLDQLASLQALERVVAARCRALEAAPANLESPNRAEDVEAQVDLGRQFSTLDSGEFSAVGHSGGIDESKESRAVGGLEGGDNRREWSIPPESLEIKEQIASGAMGSVCMAMWQGTAVAVKILSDTRIAECASALRRSLSAGGSRAPSESRGARRPLLFLHIYAYTSLSRSARQTASCSCARST